MTQASTDTTADKGEASGRPSDGLSNDTLLEWLRRMQLIREFESRTMQAYQQAKIGGFCHIYTGQEASAVGCFSSIDDADPVIVAYRDHGHALARGMHPAACIGEMFGKHMGCAKGKGGSMHMFDRPNNLYGGHGIVGAQTPLGAGLAFACKYEREVLGDDAKRVCLCFLGDGALDQGSFHEAQNLAALWSLPVVYIVENNGYSMGTSIERHAANEERITARAEAYGIEAIDFDGFNILNVYDNIKPFADKLRDEQRPGYVNLRTYRYQGHSMSDPQKYRTKDEVESYKENDPIASLASHLMGSGSDGGRDCLSEDDWDSMQKEIKKEVMDAMKLAESADDVPLDELHTDVYALPMPRLSPTGEYRHGTKNPLL